MEKIVRIGKIEEQDNFRREDILKLTPSQRVELLLELREKQFGHLAEPIRKRCLWSYREIKF